MVVGATVVVVGLTVVVVDGGTVVEVVLLGGLSPGAGSLKGTKLPELSSVQLTLKQWLALHPNTLIMQGDPAWIGMSNGLQAKPILDFALLPVHCG